MTVTELLAKLVSISSVSGNEQAIADYIETWVKQHCEFTTHRLQNSVVVHVPGRDRSKCLVFNGHIDTVAPGDIAQWDTDPLTIVERDGKIFGLGTSDMKGGDAVLLHMLQHFSKTPPPCDVFIMLVSHEEVTGEGTQSALRYLEMQLQAYQQVAAVIAEPTDLAVVLGHRGNAFVRVSFDGRGGHASVPPTPKDQAILKAQRFASSIPAKERQWAELSEGSLLGSPTIVITQLEAGTGSVNQVPTHCEMTLDIRSNELLHDQLTDLLHTWADEYAGKVALLAESPVGHCAPQELIAAVALQLANQPEGNIYASSADQCFFTQKGIPAIICGPGKHSCIHAPNEYIVADTLDRCEQRFLTILDEWAALSLPKGRA